MAQEGFLEKLRAEATCPVCLDFLKYPVTLECGHHCCAACLQQRWQDLLEILPCPVCQHHCAYKKPQKNSQLGNLVDLMKQLPSRGSKKQQQLQPLCEQHQQELSLFCEKDLELVCTQCRGSCEQQGHPLTPIKEAAAQQRRKLKSYLQILRKQLEDAQKGLEMQTKEMSNFYEMMEKQEFEIPWEFEHLKHSLRVNQNVIDNILQKDERDLAKKITECRGQMLAYGSTLKSLLREFTEMFLQTDLDLLLGIRKYYFQCSRYPNLEVPATFSYKFSEVSLSLPSNYLGLRNIISKFQVDLTFDSDTAHPSLIVSEAGKVATFSHERKNPDRFPKTKTFTSHTAVLSCEGFDAGRHFWQIEFQGAGVWAFGVCKESFPRDAQIPLSPSHGCWQYQQPESEQLDSQEVKTRVGVFLDDELGELSFYNMDLLCHLHTIADNFTERLMPCFSAKPSSLSFVMRIIKAERSCSPL
ncbi:tripartite motif-containing protein 75-like [Erinaceus europaeus]|uniref:Tripartite motif-containing protein 75-like n=1 Tax=Erinaceus europaeus TaxID=9365 RepID=A0A1S3AJA7_ERIEU|nr:tripartite motif-containing protein 75-like [Erinaceus europaeus]